MVPAISTSYTVHLEVWVARLKFSVPCDRIAAAALHTEASFVIPAGRRQSLSLKFCLVFNVPIWTNFLFSLEKQYTV